MTDHAQPMADAPLAVHFRNLRVIDRELFGVKILRGVELNICDAQGSVFLPERVLEGLDYCIASIHPPIYVGRDAQENTQAYIRAMQNPYVKILGHPEDGHVPVEFESLVQAARENEGDVLPGSLRHGGVQRPGHRALAALNDRAWH